MSKAELPEAVTKQVPKDWVAVEAFQSTVEPRQAVVLCAREPYEHGNCNWVTWRVNTVEGGSVWGHYFETLSEASASYTKRVGDLCNMLGEKVPF